MAISCWRSTGLDARPRRWRCTPRDVITLPRRPVWIPVRTYSPCTRRSSTTLPPCVSRTLTSEPDVTSRPCVGALRPTGRSLRAPQLAAGGDAAAHADRTGRCRKDPARPFSWPTRWRRTARTGRGSSSWPSSTIPARSSRPSPTHWVSICSVTATSTCSIDHLAARRLLARSRQLRAGGRCRGAGSAAVDRRDRRSAPRDQPRPVAHLRRAGPQTRSSRRRRRVGPVSRARQPPIIASTPRVSSRSTRSAWRWIASHSRSN